MTMTDNEKEQKRLERMTTEYLKKNEVKKTVNREVKKHKKYGKSASRFVKFWLPIKKAVWLLKGLIDTGKLTIPQTDYLRAQLERELKNCYEGTARNNKSS